MKLLNGLMVAILVAAPVFAQSGGFRSQPFGNVVFPGGTTTIPGVQPFANVVFPGGTGNFGLAANRGYYGQRRGSGAAILPYAVPLYVGGYGDYGCYDPSCYSYGYGYAPQQPAPPQQPNVIVVYPPASQPAGTPGPNVLVPAPPPAAPQTEIQPSDQTSEPAHYLIAFKDHTIYSAVAYWVEGDTLHYFTSPSVHNQVSLSLIDKDLTERLNREAGVTLQLPK